MSRIVITPRMVNRAYGIEAQVETSGDEACPIEFSGWTEQDFLVAMLAWYRAKQARVARESARRERREVLRAGLIDGGKR